MTNTALKFFRGANAPESAVKGAIWFNTALNIIEVYTGSKWEKYGNVQDVTFNDLKLNVKKSDGSEFTLDFSDVASANGVNASFASLKERLAGIDTTIANLNSTLTSAIGDVDDKVDALNTKVGFTAEGEVDTVIKYVDAKVAEAAGNANTALGGKVEELTNTINALDDKVDAEIERATKAEQNNANDIAAQKARIDALYAGSIEVDGETVSDEGKSVRAIAAEEVALIVDGASESYDTLKEIADWIAAHATDAAEYNSRITKNTEDIAALTKTVGDNKDAADEAIEALQGRATDLEGRATAVEGRATALETRAQSAEDRLAELEAHDEDYKDFANNAVKTAVEALDSSYVASTSAEGKVAVVTGIEIADGKIVEGEGKSTSKVDVYTVEKIDALFDAAMGDGGSVGQQITAALEGLDFTGVEAELAKNGVSVIANVTEANGQISATAVEVEKAGAAAAAEAAAKKYAEEKVAEKNVDAQGDDYVSATAADNKVTVATNVDAIRNYVLTWEGFE